MSQDQFGSEQDGEGEPNYWDLKKGKTNIPLRDIDAVAVIG